MKRLHKRCRCVRLAGHAGECNCRYPDGVAGGAGQVGPPAREWLAMIVWAAEHGIEEVTRARGDALVRISLRQIRDIAHRRLAQVIDLDVPQADRIAYDAHEALHGGHTEDDQ